MSSIAGITRNPYNLDYVPAGSSGGTAAAIAANFGAVGLGTDTGNSIRGPSSHNALVGIRPTIGLTSRDGIIPLFLGADVGGPIVRTVEDAAALLDVVAGYDPQDPITQNSEGHIPKSYKAFLDPRGLRGARIGVFRAYVDAPTGDPQIKELTEKAIQDLKVAGCQDRGPFRHSRLRSAHQGYFLRRLSIRFESLSAKITARAPPTKRWRKSSIQGCTFPTSRAV